MISLFRKLRNMNLRENRMRSYLFYALGEMALVVVGILVALQINNWNQERKLANAELNILEEIHNNLEIDSAVYSQSKFFFNSKLKDLESLNAYLDSDLTYNDTLASSFGMISLMSTPRAMKSAFDHLNNFGLENIQNDSIRIYTIRYYSVADHYYNTSSEYDFGLYFRENVYPKYFKSFSYSSRRGAVPSDYNALKSAHDFRVALDYVQNDSYFFQYGYSQIIELNRQLRKFIKDELAARG